MDYIIKKISNKSLTTALAKSFPILCAFIPLGMGFGYLATQLGLPWHLVIFTSVIVYAGSVEFIIAMMFAVAANYIDIILAAALVNLRHIFYGISVKKHYPKSFSSLKKIYMVHALTDETYGLLASENSSDTIYDKQFSLYVSILNHIYWVTGVILGVMFSNIFNIEIKGLEFILTALFVVLTIEQAYHIKKILPFVCALISSILALILLPNQMLLVAISISSFLLLIFNKSFDKSIEEINEDEVFSQ